MHRPWIFIVIEASLLRKISVCPRSPLEIFFLEEPDMTLILYLLGNAIGIGNFDAPSNVSSDQPPSKGLST